MLDLSYEITESGCWITKYKPDHKGYVSIGVAGKSFRLHRYVYMQVLKTKHIPERLFVCHSCDNRACINQSHLFLGRNIDNMQDRDNKGRQARKLKSSDIILIMNLLRLGMRTRKEICDVYDITQQTLSTILNHTWKRRI